MTPTMTLADFLLARIAEDEAVAKAASGGLDYNWGDYGINPELLVDARFFERFASPARVLAECEARRRIVAFYLGSLSARQRTRDPIRDALAEAINESHSDALKAIGIAYASHPDYRDEWKL